MEQLHLSGDLAQALDFPKAQPCSLQWAGGQLAVSMCSVHALKAFLGSKVLSKGTCGICFTRVPRPVSTSTKPKENSRSRNHIPYKWKREAPKGAGSIPKMEK